MPPQNYLPLQLFESISSGANRFVYDDILDLFHFHWFSVHGLWLFEFCCFRLFGLVNKYISRSFLNVCVGVGTFKGLFHIF